MIPFASSGAILTAAWRTGWNGGGEDKITRETTPTTIQSKKDRTLGKEVLVDRFKREEIRQSVQLCCLIAVKRGEEQEEES